MRKWYRGLSRQGRMMVRVSLAFAGAICFWMFYSSALSGGIPRAAGAALIALSAAAFAALVYLETGGKGRG